MNSWVLINPVLVAPSYDSNFITTQWTTLGQLQEDILTPPDKNKSSFIYNPFKSLEREVPLLLYGKDFGLIKETGKGWSFVLPVLYEYNQPGFTDHFRQIWMCEQVFSKAGITIEIIRSLICEK